MIDVTTFGAKGDGSTDDTTSIQAAITSAAAVNGTAFVPAGANPCVIASFITLPGQMTLRGAGNGTASGSTLKFKGNRGGACTDAQASPVNTGVKLTMSNVALTGATASITSTTGNPATIVDLGGNSVAIAPSLIAGTTVQQSQSILGAQIATNITPSTGWGTTGAAGNGVSAASGTSQSERFTITAAGTPTANPTVAITFPQAFWVAPQCTAQQIGGTGAIQALTTDGTESTTAVTLTWHGTPAAASTYTIQVNCK